MERHHQQMFQGLINPTHLFGEYLDVECLEQFVNTEKLRFEEKEEQAKEINFSISTTTPSLEDKIPFLQMLQSAESPTPRPFSPLTQASTSFQTLLKFQHNSRKKQQQQQPWESNYYYNNNNKLDMGNLQPLELESCITHDMFETKLDMGNNLQNPHSGASCLEGVSSECNREQTNSIDNGNNSGSSPACSVQLLQPQLLMRPRQKAPAITRERRKRKRTTRASKNKEEVENQRMTHIAVERNRRRQMNDHLSSLRSLMPPSYVHRGDQASIIGGAIDFVKELEQLLQSLQAQKKLRKSDELPNNNNNNNNNNIPSSPSAGLNPLTPAQVTGTPSNDGYSTDGGRSGEHRAENRSEAADIEVTVIQTHVNLKIQCGRRPGQLLKVIVALEDLRLTVLHLNITSFESSVLYSFNLKIEDECKIGSADGIAGSVHQIFNYINGST